MNLCKKLLLSLLLLLSLSQSCFGVTQFVSKINCGTVNCIGTEDYSSLATWEDATDNAGDLTAADLKVFSHGGITGTMGDGTSVTGLTSGATGTIIHTTPTQILIDAISGTFQSGEVVERVASNNVTISNAGDSAEIVASVYDDDGNLTTTTVMSGVTANSTNHRTITVPVGERHNGTVASGTKLSVNDNVITIVETNLVIEWLLITGTSNSGSTTRAIGLNTVTNLNPIIRNCIIYNYTNAGAGTGEAIGGAGGGTNSIYNTIIYGVEGAAVGISGGGITTNCYNCTFYGNSAGIGNGNGTQVAKNCLSIGNTTDYGAIESIITSGSGDTTGTLDNLVAATEFVAPTGGTLDFHLKSGAQAINAGTDLGATGGVQFDIDNRDRDTLNDTWDMGADELVAVAGARRIIIVN